MQQIERYGVIVLVFFLVTIVAVSFWGDSKSPGFWARLTGKGEAKKEQGKDTTVALVDQHVVDPNVPLTPPNAPIPPVGGTDQITGNTPTPPDQTPYTPPAGPDGTNPFVPNPPLANPGVPTPPPVVIEQPAVATNSYVVQKGDSLASIARRKLGAESRWTEIQALNKGVTAQNLQVGHTLMLPAGATVSTPKVAIKTVKPSTPDSKKSAPAIAKSTEKPSAKSAGGAIYVVKKGDGLRAIAREQLGDESRWREIVAANPGLKPERIQPGDKLRMPGSGTRSSSNGPTLASVHTSSSSSSEGPRVR